MAKNADGSYSYTIVFDGDISPAKSQLKKIFQEAQEMTREDGKLEFDLTTDKKGIEKLIKQVQDINPELAATIRLNYNSKTVREFQGVISDLVKSGTKDTKVITQELTKFIKSGIDKVDKISLDDFFNLHGGTGSKSKNNLANLINKEIGDLSSFQFDTANLSDITDYINRVRQLYGVIDEYTNKYGSNKSISNAFSNIYDSLSSSLLNNNLGDTIQKIINNDVDKLKELISRLGVITDEAKIGDGIGEQTVHLIPKIDSSEIQKEIDKHTYEVKVKPVIDFKNGKLQETIKDIAEAESLMSKTDTSRKERGFYYNSKSNFVGNSYVFDKKDEIEAQLLNAMYEYTEEQAKEMGEVIDAFYHSHPRDYSAFSPGDLKRLLEERKKHNVNKFLNSSLKEVAQFDSSDLTDDQLKDIVNLFEAKMKEIENRGMKKNEVLQMLMENGAGRIDSLDTNIYDSLYDILSKYLNNDDDKVGDIIAKIQDEVLDQVEDKYNDDNDVYGESFVQNILTIFSKEAGKVLHKLQDVEIPDNEIQDVLQEGRDNIQSYLVHDINEIMSRSQKVNITDENEADKVYREMLIQSIKDVLGHDFDVEKILKTIPLDEYTQTQAGFNIPVALTPDLNSIPDFIQKLKEELSKYDVPINVTLHNADGDDTIDDVKDNAENNRQKIQDEFDNNGKPVKYKVEPDIDEQEAGHQIGIIQNIFDETDATVYYNTAPNLKNGQVNNFVDQIQNAIDEKDLNIKVNIEPVIDTDKFSGDGNNLKKTLRDITDSEEVIHSTERSETDNKRRERAFFYNSKGNFVGNAYTYGDETSISGILAEAIYDYTKRQADAVQETIDAFYHSHPDNFASFSPADIKAAVYDKKHHDIKKYLVSSLKEVAEYNFGDLSSQDVEKIAEEFQRLRDTTHKSTEKRNEALSHYLDKFTQDEINNMSPNDKWQLILRDKLTEAIKNVKGQDFDIESVLRTIPIEEYTKTQTGANIVLAVVPDLNSIPEFLNAIQQEVDKLDPILYKVEPNINSEDINKGYESIQNRYNSYDNILYSVMPYVTMESIGSDLNLIQSYYDYNNSVKYHVEPDVDGIKITDSSGSIDKEKTTLELLPETIDNITKAVDMKINAFRKEGEVVDGVIQHEITSIQELIGWIIEVENVIKEIQNLLSTEGFDGIDRIINSIKSISDIKFENLSGLKDFKILGKFTDEFASQFDSNIGKIKTSLNGFIEMLKNNSDESGKFIGDIKDILSKSQELADLTKILSQTKGKINEVAEATVVKQQQEEIRKQQEKNKLIEEEKKKREEVFETVNKINDGIIDNSFKNQLANFNWAFTEVASSADEVNDKLKNLNSIINELYDSSKPMEERAAAFARYTKEVENLNSALKQAKADYKADKNGIRTLQSARSVILSDAIDNSDANKSKYNPEKSPLSYKQYTETYKEWLAVSKELISKTKEMANATDKTSDSYKQLTSDVKELTREASNYKKDLDDMLFDFGGERQIKAVKDYLSKIEELAGVFDGAYTSDWEKLNDIYDENTKKLKSGEISLRAYQKSLDSAIDTFEQATKSGGGNLLFSEVENAEQAFATIKQYLQSIGVTIKEELGGKMEANSDGVYKWAATIREADGEVKKLGFTFNSSSHQIRMGVKSITHELSGIPKYIDELRDKIGKLSIYWTSRYFDLQSIFQYLRQGIGIVQQYDDALVELRKVSEESIGSLKNYQQESFNLANQVGTTAVQLQKSTADWLRLGKSFEEAKRAAQETSVLMNVSEFENISEATDAMVAMKQAFDDLDYRQIIDELNIVGNNFAISTSDLAQGLQKSAAALKTQGNSLEESIALITAGNSILQDVNSTAAGIRTISLRIASSEISKKQLEDLGEDVSDYIVQTRAKLQETIKSLTKTESNKEGVNIIDPNGSLKSTYEILKEISMVYQDIQKEDKEFGTNRASALVEYLAGAFLPVLVEKLMFVLCILHISNRTYLIALVA